MNPLVTIMIPTFEQADYVSRAIESALAQDYVSIEVIVSDDFSNDNTIDITSKFKDDPRLKYLRRQVNIGRVANYKDTLENHARGEWVINLDGDDFFMDSSFISKAMKLIEENPKLEMIFANNCVVESQDGKDKYFYGNTMNYPEFIEGDDIFLNYPSGKYRLPHLTTIYKREIALNLDFYRYDITSSDLESLLRYVPGKKVGFIKDVVAAWRSHGENESLSLNIEARMRNMNLAEGPYEYLLSKNIFSSRLLGVWRNKMLYRTAYAFLAYCLEQKKYKRAIDFYKIFSTKYPHLRFKFFVDYKLYFRFFFPGKLRQLKELLFA